MSINRDNASYNAQDFEDAVKTIPELSQVIRQQHFSPESPLPEVLHKLHFIDCRFSRLELSALEMKEVRFERCQFEQIALAGGAIQHCVFLECQVNGIHLQHLHVAHLFSYRCDWKNVWLEHCQLERVTVQQGSWADSEAIACRIALFTLVEVTLSHLHFGVIAAQDWSLYRCTLEQCHWRDSSLVRMVSGSSTFSTCSLQLQPGKGPVWFKCLLTECDLNHLSLPMASFHQSQLTACDLTGSDFSASIFSEATLTDCLLSEGNLQSIQGEDARFIRCQMSGVRLEKSRLQRAEFTECLLDGCDWRQADLRASRLPDSIPSESLSTARLHGTSAAAARDAAAAEALLQAIDQWYTQFQPGPDAGLPFPTLPSGASRYV